jgi:acyl-CoA hydrolase
MEVGVKAWAENTRTGERVHVASAYLVFVAIDGEGNRQRVPELRPETPDEIRRYEGALRRRQNREAEAAQRKQAKIESRALQQL